MKLDEFIERGLFINDELIIFDESFNEYIKEDGNNDSLKLSGDLQQELTDYLVDYYESLLDDDEPFYDDEFETWLMFNQEVVIKLTTDKLKELIKL